jgi:Flp pilus assembly protein TadD
LDLAFPYWESLAAAAAMTLEDRLECAGLALRLGNREVAATQVEALLKVPDRSARTLLIASQYHAILGDSEPALAFAREAFQMEPANPTNGLALASLLTGSGKPDQAREAAAILWPLAAAPGPAQLTALAAILNSPMATRADRERVHDVLAAKPSRTLQEELVLGDARVSLDPSRQGQIADEFVERYGRGAPEEMAAVGMWLNRQQLYQRTLALLLPDLASRSPVLLDLRYQALVGSGDFRAAYDYVNKDIRGADPFQIEKLRCTAAMRAGDATAAESHLRGMLHHAGIQPQLLRIVADFALRNSNREVAGEAVKRLARSPRDAAEAYRALVLIADEQGETWLARDYGRKLIPLLPDDPTPQLQVAYYDLLLNENIEKTLLLAAKLHEDNPADFGRRALLAFAYLRSNEPQRAGELIDAQTVTWARLPPGIRATVVAILGANGRDEAARSLLRAIPLARLKPEERELIRPYLAPEAEPPLPPPPQPPALRPLPKEL